MMAYAQRSGIGWRARWVLPDGVRYGSQSGFRTKREAEAYGTERELQVRGARWFDPRGGRMTLDMWARRWFPAQDLAPATLDAYAQQYRKHIGPRWGSAPLYAISPLDVAAFEKQLRTHLAASSTAVVMAVLRDLLDDAVRERLIAFSPARAHRRRRLGPDDRREGVVVDLRTVEHIRGRLRSDEALLVLMAEFTGMRWGEACGMRRSLLELSPSTRMRRAAGVYHVDPLIGAVHEDAHARRYFGPPKGRRGRVVDLPPFLAELLLGFVGGLGERDLLFPDRNGGPRQQATWNSSRWRPACDGHPGARAKADEDPICAGLRFHDLRHCHKAMLNALGTPPVLQNDRLGHRQPTYDHPTPQMRADLVAGLQAMWTNLRPYEGTAPQESASSSCITRLMHGEVGGVDRQKFANVAGGSSLDIHTIN
jgi:integrase